MFSKQKDTDLIILQKLDDKSLFQTCLVNKELNKICNDNGFWHNRFLNKFGEDWVKDINNWKNRYLDVVKHLNLFRSNPWSIFTFIDRKNLYNMKNFPSDLPLKIKGPLSAIVGENIILKDAPILILDNFYFTNLGEIIRIGHKDINSNSYTPYKHYPQKGEKYVTPISLIIETYKINPKTKFELKWDRKNEIMYFE